MSTPTPDQQATWVLPLADLAAIGKVLYLADEKFLTWKGLTEGDLARAQRAFEEIDGGLEGVIGEDWLDGLDIAPPAPTPFAKLVAVLK